MKLTTNLFRDASTITSLLAFIAAIPYEKDVMGLIPPAWAPKILVASAAATALLRLMPRILGIFGIVVPSTTPKIEPEPPPAP